MKFVDAVQGERGSLSEAGVQFGRVQAVPHGVPARGHRARVSTDQQRLAVTGQPQARRLQPVRGKDLVEVVPGHQSGDVERAGYVAVFAVQCLGEEVLAQACRDGQIRHRVRAPGPSVVAVAAAGAAAVRGDGAAAPGGDDQPAGADHAAGHRLKDVGGNPRVRAWRMAYSSRHPSARADGPDSSSAAPAPPPSARPGWRGRDGGGTGSARGVPPPLRQG